MCRSGAAFAASVRKGYAGWPSVTLNLAETAFRGALGAHMILPSVAMFVGAAGSPDREKTRMQMNRRSLPRYLGVLTVVIALAVSSFGCGANIERGKVLFGTDKPAEDSKCTASAAVTSVSVTTSVYATYVFKAKPADERLSRSSWNLV
jgi:hypothetical protein